MAVKAQYSQTDKGFLDRMTHLYAQQCTLGKNICGGSLGSQLPEEMKALESGLTEAGGPGLLETGVKPLQVTAPTPAGPAPTGGVA